MQGLNESREQSGRGCRRRCRGRSGSGRALRRRQRASSTRAGRRSRTSARCRSIKGAATVARGHAGRVRAERRPDVRRCCSRRRAPARPHTSSCVKKKLPWQGKIAGRQERRRHEHRHQVGGDRSSATPLEHAAPTLRLRGVGRRFGGLHAVRDVDLDVAHGERRAILGPNGAGKTTLFNLICGDIPPSSGHDRAVRARTSRRSPARKRAKLGLARTYQQSRMLLGTDGRGQHLPLDRRRRRRPAPAGRPAAARPGVPRARARGRRAGRDRPQARRARRRPLARRASSGRDRDGARRGAADAHARRARLGPVARRAPAPHRAPPRARSATITLILIEHDMDIALRVASG